MLKISKQRRAGDLLGTIFPGYKDKIWATLDPGMKKKLIIRKNDAYENALQLHRQWGQLLTSYKQSEASMKPSHKYRKPAVDWRRQEARGTLHVGRFYEGPAAPGSNVPSDYTPGNTFNRLDNVHAPFSDAEWVERKKHRSWDMVHVLYTMLGGFFAYRLAGDWPVVWC